MRAVDPRGKMEMKLRRDGSLPVYRQIASRLQYEIVTGAREAGHRLPSLRDAAEAWGVNLHTVRKAYKELEAIGLVQMTRPTGTRVLPLSPGPDSEETTLGTFLGRISQEARDRFGLNAGELATKIAVQAEGSRISASGRAGAVLECSRTLSSMLAEVLSRRLHVELEPRDLREPDPIPAGPVFGTWFHHAELTERLHGRPADLHLLRIRPEERQLEDLHESRAEGRLWSVILLDRHPASGHQLAIDFRSRLGPGVPIEIRIPSDPVRGFPGHQPGTVVVASPQTWDDLPSDLRERTDVKLLRYEIEEKDLDRMATHFPQDGADGHRAENPC